MIITYFSTLYQKECTFHVFGEITFEDGEIHFASGGHRYALDSKYVIKIEQGE